MSLEDEPGAQPPGPEPPLGDEPAADRPSVEDLPLPSDLPTAAPPRNATSRADKRRNQRR